jgi:Rieske Fe-S protein
MSASAIHFNFLMKRSEFLQISCTGCMLSAAGLLSVTELLSCAAGAGMRIYKTQVADKMIAVPESRVAGEAITIVRGKGMDYDIALRRGTDAGAYEALLLRCTHFNNPLQPAGNGYHCDLHGSEFDLHGKVLKGPAGKPLAQLQCTVTNGNILIHV